MLTQKAGQAGGFYEWRQEKAGVAGTQKDDVRGEIFTEADGEYPSLASKKEAEFLSGFCAVDHPECL